MTKKEERPPFREIAETGDGLTIRVGDDESVSETRLTAEALTLCCMSRRDYDEGSNKDVRA